MQVLVEQLKGVRRRAWLMLLAIRTSRWVAWAMAAALGLAMVDYWLHLPAWARLGIIIIALAVGAVSAWSGLGRLGQVKPALTELALRLERLYPSATGRLASAVAFAAHPEALTDSSVTRQLADHTQQAAAGSIEPVQVRRLINPARTLRSLVLLACACAVIAAVAAAAPGHAATALRRWTMPLGPAAWPKRYEVRSATHMTFAPNNRPLAVRARVVRGDRRRLRTWVMYRFVDGSQMHGGWQRAIMTRQDAAASPGLYEKLIDPVAGAKSVQLYFKAGDDQTAVQSVNLIEPPALLSASAEVQPPDYARTLIAVDRHDLLTGRETTTTVAAFDGSRIDLTLRFNKPLPSAGPISPTVTADDLPWLRSTFVGLIDQAEMPDVEQMQMSFDAPPQEPDVWRLSWTLRRPAQLAMHLRDEHGLTHDDPRRFRFEVRNDVLPRVAVVEPPADEAVLATARLSVAAEARDDVAVAHLKLLASPGERGEPLTLADGETLQPRARSEAVLDLTPLKLNAGNEVTITALARDNYLLDGQGHDEVASAPRRVRIISAEQLVRQVRTELADVRRQAIVAETRQDELMDAPVSDATVRQQQELADRVSAMQRRVDRLQQRVGMNRLDDQALEQLLDESGQSLAQATKAAGRAADHTARAVQEAMKDLPDAAQQQVELEAARQKKQQVQQELAKLIDLLDQGRDADRLAQQLRNLAAEQRRLAEQVQELMPQMLGRTEDELSEAQREALKDVQAAQQSLQDQSKRLTEQMRTSSATLSRSPSAEDQASARALGDAADTAAQRGLSELMNQAARSVGSNRLSQASQQQQQSSDVLEEMLEQLERRDQLRREILSRQLENLAQAIERLIRQQEAQLDRLRSAQELAGLDLGLLGLRRNTLAVAEQARQMDRRVEPVANLLTEAAKQQQEGVQHLRAAPPAREPTETAERAALAKLNEALEEARRLLAESRDEDANRRRAALITAYRKALAEQQAITAESQKLMAVAAAGRDRQWRGKTMQLGHRQADLRVELHKIGQSEELESTVVFKAMHEQMDQWCGAAVTALRGGTIDQRTLFVQRSVAETIEQLIDALKRQQQQDQPFAGSGGGGGQGGGKPPIIPPLAELKLLRGAQQRVHALTRMTAEQTETPVDQADQMLGDLARQQQHLADTAHQLLQKALQRQARLAEPTGDIK